MAKKKALLKSSLENVETWIKNVDFPAWSASIQEYSSGVVMRLPPPEKAKIGHWIQEIQKIKTSEDDQRVKIKKIEKLGVPLLIADLFKNQLSHVAENKKLSKETVRKALDGAQMLATSLLLRRATPFSIALIAGVGINKLVPRLLLLPRSDSLLETIASLIREPQA